MRKQNHSSVSAIDEHEYIQQTQQHLQHNRAQILFGLIQFYTQPKKNLQ